MGSPSDPRPAGGARVSPWWLRWTAVVAGTGVFSWALAAIINGGRPSSPHGGPGSSPPSSASPPRALAVTPGDVDPDGPGVFVRPFDPEESSPAWSQGGARPAWGRGEWWEWEEEGEGHEHGEEEFDEDDDRPWRPPARGWAVFPEPPGGALDARSRPS